MKLFRKFPFISANIDNLNFKYGIRKDNVRKRK